MFKHIMIASATLALVSTSSALAASTNSYSLNPPAAPAYNAWKQQVASTPVGTVCRVGMSCDCDTLKGEAPVAVWKGNTMIGHVCRTMEPNAQRLGKCPGGLQPVFDGTAIEQCAPKVIEKRVPYAVPVDRPVYINRPAAVQAAPAPQPAVWGSVRDERTNLNSPIPNQNNDYTSVRREANLAHVIGKGLDAAGQVGSSFLYGSSLPKPVGTTISNAVSATTGAISNNSSSTSRGGNATATNGPIDITNTATNRGGDVTMPTGGRPDNNGGTSPDPMRPNPPMGGGRIDHGGGTSADPILGQGPAVTTGDTFTPVNVLPPLVDQAMGMSTGSTFVGDVLVSPSPPFNGTVVDPVILPTPVSTGRRPDSFAGTSG